MANLYLDVEFTHIPLRMTTPFCMYAPDNLVLIWGDLVRNTCNANYSKLTGCRYLLTELHNVNTT